MGEILWSPRNLNGFGSPIFSRLVIREMLKVRDNGERTPHTGLVFNPLRTTPNIGEVNINYTFTLMHVGLKDYIRNNMNHTRVCLETSNQMIGELESSTD